jgi:mRNA-degrading endonuclease YafQ of YafQ-DinJ toxin-antitoxin module
MKITYSKAFSKQFKKLPTKSQKQFFLRLDLLVTDRSYPTLKVHKLTAQYRGHSSFNVTADIRAVFYEKKSGDVDLVAIGSHSELYE